MRNKTSQMKIVKFLLRKYAICVIKSYDCVDLMEQLATFVCVCVWSFNNKAHISS